MKKSKFILLGLFIIISLSSEAQKRKIKNVLFTVRFTNNQNYRHVDLWYAGVISKQSKFNNQLHWAKLIWLNKHTLVCVGDTINK